MLKIVKIVCNDYHHKLGYALKNAVYYNQPLCVMLNLITGHTTAHCMLVYYTILHTLCSVNCADVSMLALFTLRHVHFEILRQKVVAQTLTIINFKFSFGVHTV